MVVIPTYNERDNIEKLVLAILELKQNFYIAIVDDNSPDGTGQIADDLAMRYPEVSVIHRKEKTGIGQAYIDGFKYALSNGVEYIFQMDADFSHDPALLPTFLEMLKGNDLVIGSRYKGGVRVLNWDFKRLLLSKFATKYVNIITGLPVTDATGGFKGFRRKVLECIDLDKIRSDGYSFQIEITYIAYKKHFKIGEVPIIFVDRHAGTSKMTRRIIWEAIWMVWRLLFKWKI
jgi:dolichol-phosphate mannosyltransferase